MADQLTDGRRFRVLTIVDVFTRESLATEVGSSLKGADVVEALNQIRAGRGANLAGSLRTLMREAFSRQFAIRTPKQWIILADVDLERRWLAFAYAEIELRGLPGS